MYVYIIDKEEVMETDKAAHDFSESCKCSVYARYLVLGVRGRPNLDAINSIRGVFDSWFTGELHIVFNPLDSTIASRGGGREIRIMTPKASLPVAGLQVLLDCARSLYARGERLPD